MIDKWFPIDDSISSTSSCRTTYKSCRKEASDKFAQSAKEIAQDFHSDEISDGQRSYRLRNTKDTYEKDVKKCIDTYHQCNG